VDQFLVSQNTPERRKARKNVARIRERITNRRLDFAHQTSRRMADQHGTIVFESLMIRNMQKTIVWQKALRMFPGISSPQSPRTKRRKPVLT